MGVEDDEGIRINCYWLEAAHSLTVVAQTSQKIFIRAATVREWLQHPFHNP